MTDPNASLVGTELFRLRSRAADLVFGGALGAYIGLSFVDESVSAGGYLNLAGLLALLAIGVNFIVLAGERASEYKFRGVVLYLVASLLYIGLLSVLTIGARVDWMLLSTMMGVWLLYSVMSGFLIKSDKSEPNV